ncbi:MAG: zinc ribbon domain-containing protein [Thermoplasmata archaeon]
MPVCLHCGTLADEGALFCTKCGWTLPQDERSVGGMSAARLAPSVPAPSASPPPPFVPMPMPPPTAPPFPPAWPATPGAYPAPGKPCVRCQTRISPAAVYCPVCQSPQ